jgi:hypothetical protein
VQMAALDQERAGAAPHVFAVLCEADFGQFWYGDQVALLPLVQQMAFVPFVEQSVGYNAGYGNRAERPGDQAPRLPLNSLPPAKERSNGK